MKFIHVLFLIIPLCASHTAKACDVQRSCFLNVQYLPQDTLSQLQSRFGGRVIRVETLPDNTMQVQLMTQDNRIVFVTLDPQGNILTVQE